MLSERAPIEKVSSLSKRYIIVRTVIDWLAEFEAAGQSIDKILADVNSYLAEAEVVISNRLKTTAGMFHYATNQIHLNPKLSGNTLFEVFIHELAHGVAGRGTGHGPEWCAVMERWGHAAERCHSIPSLMALHKPREKKIVAICGACGVEFRRKRRFNRDDRRRTRDGMLIHAGCGGELAEDF